VLLEATSSAATAADPNSKSAQASEKLEADLNRFLNLLVTQLKNQDPLDPLDANEFTSQLVQFASVEQQIYQNANLEKMLEIQQTSQAADVVSYLGTTIESSGNQSYYEGNPIDFTYSLEKNATSVTISVQNSAGGTVFTADGDATVGSHGVTWDGKDDFGNPQKDGTYTIIVSAQNAVGDLQDVAQTIYGRVSGASTEGGNVTLFVGDVEVAIEDVISVKESPATP